MKTVVLYNIISFIILVALILDVYKRQHMLFCSDQRRSDSEAVLSVGLFVLHKFLEFC